MDKMKEIIKLAIFIILLILIITFVINLLPIFIILFIAYLLINYFKKEKNSDKQETENNKKVNRKTKDMSEMDLAIHMSEKSNKK